MFGLFVWSVTIAGPAAAADAADLQDPFAVRKSDARAIVPTELRDPFAPALPATTATRPVPSDPGLRAVPFTPEHAPVFAREHDLRDPFPT